jgi:hypothetical protein
MTKLLDYKDIRHHIRFLWQYLAIWLQYINESCEYTLSFLDCATVGRPDFSGWAAFPPVYNSNNEKALRYNLNCLSVFPLGSLLLKQALTRMRTTIWVIFISFPLFQNKHWDDLKVQSCCRKLLVQSAPFKYFKIHSPSRYGTTQILLHFQIICIIKSKLLCLFINVLLLIT